MAILAFILNGIAVVLNFFLNFILILVFARVVISWLSADPSNPIVRFIQDSTEPLMAPSRRVLSRLFGARIYSMGIDFSPILLLAVIYFLQASIVPALQYYARSLL